MSDERVTIRQGDYGPYVAPGQDTNRVRRKTWRRHPDCAIPSPHSPHSIECEDVDEGLCMGAGIGEPTPQIPGPVWAYMQPRWEKRALPRLQEEAEKCLRSVTSRLHSCRNLADVRLEIIPREIGHYYKVVVEVHEEQNLDMITTLAKDYVEKRYTDTDVEIVYKEPE